MVLTILSAALNCLKLGAREYPNHITISTGSDHPAYMTYQWATNNPNSYLMPSRTFHSSYEPIH